MIIHNYHEQEKERNLRKKARGKNWLRKLLVISLAINIVFISVAIIGGSYSIRKRIRRGDFNDSFQQASDKFKRQIGKVYLHTKSLFVSTIPTIELNIKFKDYTKLEEKRKEALRLGLLLAGDSDFVPATLVYEGKDIPVKLRLKGDNADSLVRDKWPFRINTKSGYAFKGMSVFSIHHPEERNYAYEWAYLYNLKQEGVLAPRYEFIRVIINGKNKGIYALEESFAKELVESQGAREGIIIKFNEEPYWVQLAYLFYDKYLPERTAVPHYPEYFLLQRRGWLNVDFDTFSSTKIAKSETLSLQRDTALGLMESFRKGEKKASEVFDVEKISRFIAVAHLWGGEHGLSWKDTRFYFNPITAKIEPIGFDSMSGLWEDSGLVAAQRLSGGALSDEFPWGDWDWVALALRDKIMAQAYMKEALRIIDPQYLVDLRKKMDKELNSQLKILWYEYPEVIDWSIIEHNRELFRRVLNPSYSIRAYAYPEVTYDNNAGVYYLKISLDNLLTLPVKILGVRINDNFIDIKNAKTDLSPDKGNINEDMVIDAMWPLVSQEYTIYVPVSKELVIEGKIDINTKIEVANTILGANNPYSTKAILMPKPQFVENIPAQPAIDEALEKHQFLAYDKDSNSLFIKKGEWDVKGDLLIPKGLNLMAQSGTTLKFQKGAILFTTSAVIFEGSKDYPVKLTSQGDGWGGLVVLNAKDKSILNRAIIENYNGIERGGWILTGGITFYNTSAAFNKFTAQNNQCEDALNFVHVDYTMTNSLFRNTSSDAFDNDFCQGVIKDTIFMDIKGDALDVSGTNLEVENMKAFRLGDKGLSVGEKSDVYAQNIVVEEADFGAASKDLSKLEIDDIQITNTKVGLASYQKKPEYGPAQIKANNVYFNQVAEEALCQTGSSITANGKEYAAKEVDIDKLYEKWTGTK